MRIHDLETPALLIDAAVLDSNLRRMAKYTQEKGLHLRPHTKTHKIPEIAHLQINHGAAGITVAKLGEAEIMAAAGIEDILIVYPLWGMHNWRRLAALAAQVKMAVALDSLEVASGISKAAEESGVKVGVRLEFDTGFKRCGLPVAERSIEIALRVAELPGLTWEGISVYPGHLMGDDEIRKKQLIAENKTLDELYRLLNDAGIEYPIVSGGNTPAAYSSHNFHGLTEIRPGTYVFNDRNTVDAESASWDQCALTVLTTVVSTSVQGRAIVDAGSKTLSADTLLTGAGQHYGLVKDRPGLIVDDLSEEHGHLLLADEEHVSLGDRVRIIPNHVCPCVNLADYVNVVDGEAVIERWKVRGRGKNS